MSISLSIPADVSALVARYQGARPVVLGLVARAMDDENRDTVSHVQETKLTAAGPQFLNVQSGRLRRSIRATKATITGDSVASTIGSNVKYAAAHEYGFRGTENVRGFVRHIFRHTSLRTGKRLKRKVDTGNTATVRPFTRQGNVRERAPIRTGIGECAANYGLRIGGLIRREFGRE